MVLADVCASLFACCVLAAIEWFGLWKVVIIGDTLQLRAFIVPSILK